jgi:hypothetical protein
VTVSVYTERVLFSCKSIWMSFGGGGGGEGGSGPPGKLVMLVESDPGYSRKIIVNLSLLTTGTFVYKCVLCEFSQ